MTFKSTVGELEALTRQREALDEKLRARHGRERTGYKTEWAIGGLAVATAGASLPVPFVSTGLFAVGSVVAAGAMAISLAKASAFLMEIWREKRLDLVEEKIKFAAAMGELTPLERERAGLERKITASDALTDKVGMGSPWINAGVATGAVGVIASGLPLSNLLVLGGGSMMAAGVAIALARLGATSLNARREQRIDQLDNAIAQEKESGVAAPAPSMLGRLLHRRSAASHAEEAADEAKAKSQATPKRIAPKA